MSSWAYGLVEDDEGLYLCEVYMLGKKPKDFGFYNLVWKDINKETVEMIKKDICDQLDVIVFDKKRKYKFKVENNG